MRKGNRAARRYLRNVKDWLPCSGKLKREIMARIKNVLDDYLAEHPDADLWNCPIDLACRSKLHRPM